MWASRRLRAHADGPISDQPQSGHRRRPFRRGVSGDVARCAREDPPTLRCSCAIPSASERPWPSAAMATCWRLRRRHWKMRGAGTRSRTSSSRSRRTRHVWHRRILSTCCPSRRRNWQSAAVLIRSSPAIRNQSVHGKGHQVRRHDQELTIDDAGHFEVVAPTSKAWPLVREAICARRGLPTNDGQPRLLFAQQVGQVVNHPILTLWTRSILAACTVASMTRGRENLLQSRWVARWSWEKFDAMAEPSQFANHGASADLLGLHADGGPAFFVAHALVQDLPDQSTQPVGDRADRLGMSEARDDPKVHEPPRPISSTRTEI